MPVSVAIPKQAMTPTRTVALKSMGGELQSRAMILGNKKQEEGPAGRVSGTANIIMAASAKS